MASRLQYLERAAVILGALCGMVALVWQISDSVRSRSERIAVEVKDRVNEVEVRVTNRGDHPVYVIAIAARYGGNGETHMYVYEDSQPPLPLERNATHLFKAAHDLRIPAQPSVYLKTSRALYEWKGGTLVSVPLAE
jgi:hypothetical protein